MARKIRVGRPWSDKAHAFRESVLRERALSAEERAARPNVAQWYAGRSVLVTGASGFLGRVLVEFLLRCCPDIARVYVVLRSRKGVPAQDRLPVLFDVPLFDRLRSEQPQALSKVVALTGDMEALSLGLSEEDRRRVCAEVSVVFHVAASVRFDDPFRKAVFTNVRSAREMVTLARNMPRLKALVHVSTAYCNIDRNPVEEKVYPTQHDWQEAIRWAEQIPDNSQNAVNSLGEKLLGFHPNTYTYTKALAERLMEDAAETLPVVITRPSIVVGSYEDPIPGWVDNLNGLSGMWAALFMGLLATVPGPSRYLDVQPVDVCAKLIVLASWAKGLGVKLSPDERAVDVVNVTVGDTVSISYDDFEWATECYKEKVIFPQTVRTPRVIYENCPVVYAAKVLYLHIWFGTLLDLLARATGVKPRAMSLYRKAEVARQATDPFVRPTPFTFAMENQHKLQVLTHPADEEKLGFLAMYSYRDNRETNADAIVKSARGILLYVMKEEDNVEKGRQRLARLKWIELAYHSAMSLLGLSLCFLLARAFGKL